MRFSSTLLAAVVSSTYQTISSAEYVTSFDTGTLNPDAGFKEFAFVNRVTVPAYPNMTGYGLGAMEQIAYDPSSHFVYGISEQGSLSMTKFDGKDFELTDLFLTFDGMSLTDVELCGGYLFVSGSNGLNPGKVFIYKALTKDSTTVPESIGSVEVGVVPDMILPNPDCTIVAVANEGEGKYDISEGLIDPVGSVTLLSNFDSVTATHISLDKWDDETLLSKGVHMPLTKNALEYWDDHSSIADDLNFTKARADYSSDMNLEPEYLAWSADGKTLFVNLQENSALITIDVTSASDASAAEIFGYGLKDWSDTPIDVFEDDACITRKVKGLYSTRTPDSIVSVVVDGKHYILTANEGDDKEYGDYEEKTKAKDIFDGSTLALAGMTVDSSIFDPADITAGTSYVFNADCEDETSPYDGCASSMRMTVGSSMVDYSNPKAPHISKLVALGGRGISIYELSSDKLDLKLAWDSGAEFETEGCKAFPWAHNGIQDEEFAPVGGELYEIADEDLKETLDEVNDPEEDGCEDGGDGKPGACPLGKTVDARSQKDGYAAEAIVVGEACGRLFTVTVSEKNSVGFLYDITDITAPELFQVFHLSPISETLNPGLAYKEGKLGEIDAESIVFVGESDSPSGKAGILFAGAWSGTVSWWEFTCKPLQEDEPTSSAHGSMNSLRTVLAAGVIAAGLQML